MSETVTGGSATATGGSASSSSYSSVTIQSTSHQQFQCPEIDAASSVAAITFLIGMMLVIRGRKAKI